MSDFSVHTGDFAEVLRGFSGMLGDLEEVGSRIVSGDPGAVGHPELGSAVGGYGESWAGGVRMLHETVAQLSENLSKTASVYEAADDSVRGSFSE